MSSGPPTRNGRPGARAAALAPTVATGPGATDATAPAADDWHEASAEIGRLGRYELRGVLGAGGMGVVFEAIDPELQRPVAVKVLHPGGTVDGRGAERLRREGQTMARLTHPNVIRVYDVGVAQGRTFVAMELVRGATLADWVEKHERSAEEVIAAYVQAGRGLAAAHDAGLVHRDFKPHNVLVGDDGRVLVTDFGLARAVDPARAAAAAAAREPSSARAPVAVSVTRTDVVEGTPAFMAPEQRAGEPVDARADQFSFCLSLWRALAGSGPRDSWTASTVAQGAPFASIRLDPSAVRRIPSRIRGALRRGLSMDPARRFASMHDLLAVLEPPRARTLVYAVAAVAVVIAGSATWIATGRDHGVVPADPCAVAIDRAGTIWNDEARAAVRAAFLATGRSYAGTSFDELARQLDAGLRAWTVARRDNCEATRVRREQSDAMMDLRAACLQRRLDGVAAFVDALRTADATAVDGAPTAAATIGDVTACADAAALARRAPLPPDPATRAAIADLERDLSTARASVAAGRLANGLTLAEQVVARARPLGYAPLLADALAAVGDAHVAMEQAAPALAAYEEATLAAEAGGDDLLRFECEAALVRVLGYSLERDDDATEHARRAEALLARLGPDPRRAGLLARNRATVDWWAGRYEPGLARVDEAIALYEQVDPNGVELARTLHLRAILHSDTQDPEGAVATERRARAIAEAALGPRHPVVGTILLTAGGALRRLERYDEARDTLALALAIFEEVHGAESMRVTLVLQELATLYLDQGQFDDAIAMLRRGVASFEALVGPDHSRTALMVERLGAALSKAGHADEAERTIRRAIAIHTARLGPDSPATAASVEELGKHFARIGDHREARTALVEAVRALDASQGPGNPRSARPLILLGDTERALGHPAAAIAAYERALAAMSAEDPARIDVAAKRDAIRR